MLTGSLEKLLIGCGVMLVDLGFGISHHRETSQPKEEPWTMKVVVHKGDWLSTGKWLLIHIVGDNCSFWNAAAQIVTLTLYRPASRLMTAHYPQEAVPRPPSTPAPDGSASCARLSLRCPWSGSLPLSWSS